MKRFFIVCTVLAVTSVALSLNVVPMRCADCGRIILRTSAYAALFGGHDYLHGYLIDVCRVNHPAADGQMSPKMAAGTPATANRVEATAERPS